MEVHPEIVSGLLWQGVWVVCQEFGCRRMQAKSGADVFWRLK